MSERIEEIDHVAYAREVYEANDGLYADAEESDMIVPLPMDHVTLRGILTHIDHLTAELARRHHQVETLRAACINAKDALLRSNSRRRDALVRDAIDWLIVPMAATAEPGEEGGGNATG